MNKLEQYLDQVCRSIGGPRSLREHVRQELREHLLDAVAQHQGAGLPEDEAIARALQEFGKPEEVRSELEATHGQRMLAIVIDKALEWKERTMRAKWLWATWAYLGLVVVLALEGLFITFLSVWIVPKFQKLLRDGMIDAGLFEEQNLDWIPRYLYTLQEVTGKYTTLLILAVALLWAVFEWRVRSENKPLMRLSALGTAAVGLMVVIILAAGSLVITFCLAMPALAQMARPFAREQVATVDAAASALEQALAKPDWKAVQKHADQATSALNRLEHGPALTALSTWERDRPSADMLRTQLTSAQEHWREVQRAIASKDTAQVRSALGAFRKAFSLVQTASRQPER